MRLSPKVVPSISRQAIELLMQEGDIEVERVRIADAEMDLSAIMREYLTNEERVVQATREALERRGQDNSKFEQTKREMADLRGFKTGDEGIEYVIGQMIEFLLISRNVEEVFAGDEVLRGKLRAVMSRLLALEPEPGPSGAGSDPGRLPPVGSTGGAGSTGAPTLVGDQRPAPSPPLDRDDGFDVD
jgi:hypothetical protein